MAFISECGGCPLSAIERLTTQRELADYFQACDRELVAPSHKAETNIVIHLGPDQNPSVVTIKKSAWPTVTALNHVHGAEFHMRVRRHRSGVLLVYGSVSKTAKNRHRASIFGDVIQRGRLCRNMADVERAVAYLRSELGIEKQDKLEP